MSRLVMRVLLFVATAMLPGCGPGRVSMKEIETELNLPPEMLQFDGPKCILMQVICPEAILENEDVPFSVYVDGRLVLDAVLEKTKTPSARYSSTLFALGEGTYKIRACDIRTGEEAEASITTDGKEPQTIVIHLRPARVVVCVGHQIPV